MHPLCVWVSTCSPAGKAAEFLKMYRVEKNKGIPVCYWLEFEALQAGSRKAVSAKLSLVKTELPSSATVQEQEASSAVPVAAHDDDEASKASSSASSQLAVGASSSSQVPAPTVAAAKPSSALKRIKRSCIAVRSWSAHTGSVLTGRFQ